MSSFVGSRLRQARVARGLTAVTLSDILGVTRQAVSQYEKERSVPSDEAFGKLCAALNVQPQFFYRPVSTHIDDGPIFYRSLTTATKTARARAEQRFEWLKEIIVFLQQHLTFPDVNLPEFNPPSDPREISEEEIEEAATKSRRHWNLGDKPISNVTRLLEKNGVIVVRHELCADKFDAFSQWSKMTSAPCAVLGEDKASAVRSRFDACHELAHLVLHKHVSRKMFNTKVVYKLMEQQAHRFAGAFLMPASTFASDLLIPDLNLMRDLKATWKTAISAMIMRAAHLGIIQDEKKQRRLFINRTQRGWTTREPLDDTLEIEQPNYIRRCFQVLLKSQIVDRAEIEAKFGFSLEEVEKLCSLPSGTLSDDKDEAPVVLKFGGVG